MTTCLNALLLLWVRNEWRGKLGDDDDDDDDFFYDDPSFCPNKFTPK